jgi:mercuric ion transport protein
MNDQARSAPKERETTKETGALLLAIGGLAAAFGAASCCAIPMLLGSLGLGSAWLAGVAIVAAPHRIALITAAAVCLIGAGAVLAWYRRALTCASGTGCGDPPITPLIIGLLSLGATLAIAGYLFA